VRIALCLICLVARVAVAQAPPSEADQLFQEGLALIEKGDYDAACAKFEQSLAKDPRALGTLMNLGRCNEKRGKVATAIASYQEALDRATAANAAATRDKAKERIAALSPQVPIVTLTRKAARLPDEKLVVDDKVVPPAQTELRVDPGHHTLVLTAPGRLPYQKDFDIAASAKLVLELPVLEAPAKPITPTATSSRHTIGKIATFGGAGVAVLGGVLAIYAKREYDKQFDDPDGSGPATANCGANPPIGDAPTCNATGQSATDRARSIGTAATIVSAVGIAAAATGIVLWVTSPKESATKQARLVPVGGPSHAGLALVGRF
jgi:tetratricopeptide (TPR) repeat protein